MTNTFKLICNLFKINGIDYKIEDESNHNINQTALKVRGQAKEALIILGKIGNGNLSRAGRTAFWQKGTSFLFMVIDANADGTMDLGILDLSDPLEKVVSVLNELEIKYTATLTDKDLQLKLEPHPFSLVALERMFEANKAFKLKNKFTARNVSPQFVLTSGSCTINVKKDLISLY